MAERNLELYADNGRIKLQWQWSTGGGGVISGAAINIYDGEGTFLGSASLRLEEAKALRAHIDEMIANAPR